MNQLVNVEMSKFEFVAGFSAFNLCEWVDLGCTATDDMAPG